MVTVSGNSASSGTGGGILVEGSSAAVTILQSTIADNDASTSGGGLRIAAGNVLLHNTLIADNSATTSNPDVYGAVLAASSYNLVGDGTGLSGISDGQDGNQVGTGGSPIDARLGPLADNGGPTQTHALRVGSPALDAGSDGLAVSNLPRSSAVAYDRLGRKAAVTQTDPDGIGGGSAPTVTGGFRSRQTSEACWESCYCRIETPKEANPHGLAPWIFRFAAKRSRIII